MADTPERTATLGLAPSTISTYDWRVRYPQKEAGVEFVPDNIFSVIADYPITFPGSFSSPRDTQIRLVNYIRSDGTSIPRLKILLKNSDYEYWALRDQPTDQIDTRVVIFEHPNSGQTKYVSVTESKSKNPSFQLELMKRVTS